jgi:hypothetical protein
MLLKKFLTSANVIQLKSVFERLRDFGNFGQILSLSIIKSKDALIITS